MCSIGMANPSHVHAGTFALFTEKVKALFVGEKVANEETLATSQTMALFNANVNFCEDIIPLGIEISTRYSLVFGKRAIFFTFP